MGRRRLKVDAHGSARRQADRALHDVERRIGGRILCHVAGGIHASVRGRSITVAAIEHDSCVAHGHALDPAQETDDIACAQRRLPEWHPLAAGRHTVEELAHEVRIRRVAGDHEDGPGASLGRDIDEARRQSLRCEVQTERRIRGGVAARGCTSGHENLALEPVDVLGTAERAFAIVRRSRACAERDGRRQDDQVDVANHGRVDTVQLFGAPTQIQLRIRSSWAADSETPRAGIMLPEHIPMPVSLLMR